MISQTDIVSELTNAATQVRAEIVDITKLQTELRCRDLELSAFEATLRAIRRPWRPRDNSKFVDWTFFAKDVKIDRSGIYGRFGNTISCKAFFVREVLDDIPHRTEIPLECASADHIDALPCTTDGCRGQRYLIGQYTGRETVASCKRDLEDVFELTISRICLQCRIISPAGQMQRYESFMYLPRNPYY